MLTMAEPYNIHVGFVLLVQVVLYTCTCTYMYVHVVITCAGNREFKMMQIGTLCFFAFFALS